MVVSTKYQSYYLEKLNLDDDIHSSIYIILSQDVYARKFIRLKQVNDLLTVSDEYVGDPTFESCLSSVFCLL